MLVREVMTSGVEAIQPDSTLEEAAAKMERFDIGMLPVCEHDRLIGMLTDRDITVRSVAHGEDPTLDRVRDIMTAKTIFCFEDQDVGEAARLMEENQIRRLPVLDRNRQLVGVISLGKLAVEVDDKHRVGEVLKGVSEPPAPKIKNQPVGIGEPSVAHAQPVDPEAQALHTIGKEQRQLQDVLPEIKEVAQKVGGMKQLAEIAKTLNQGQE